MAEMVVFILLILLIGALVLMFRLSDQNAQLREENLQLRERILRGRYER